MPNIDHALLQRLEDRAKAENITVETLLERFLASQASEKAHLESLVENFDGNAWLIDKQYHLLVANKTFLQALAYVEGRPVLIGENLLKLKFPVAILEHWRQLYDRTLAGEQFSIEMQTQYSPLPLEMEYRFNPVTDANGQIIGASVFVRDISSYKQTERSLRESEGRFKLATQMAGLGIWDWDIASDKTAWYGEMFNIYGISEAEFTGMGTDYIHFTREDYRLAQVGNIQNAFQNGMTEAEILAGETIPVDPKELCIVQADGSERFTRGDAIAIIDANGQPIRMLGVTVDITEQKLLEQNLRIKDSAIESSITAIALADLEGRLTYVNQAFLELWKLSSKAEAIGHSVLDFWLNPDEAMAVVSAIQSQKAFRTTMHAKLADGTFAEIELVASLVTDADGQALCMMGSFTDMTKQLQAEQLRLEQEGLKARLKKEQEYNILIQKAISALTHDVHTPLTVISNAKQLLDRYYDRLDEDKRREKLDSIGKQLHYVLELLNEMSLTIKGRLDERVFQAQTLNLPALCQASLNEIQETIGHQHHFSFITDGSVQLIQADETLLSRVLLNLLSNAVKFSPEGTEIRLELHRHENRIHLRVCDSGMGISPEDLPQIFEPFYRAEAVRTIRGTGLGLNIVKDCVERHQGQIRIDTELGKGSCFTVELPYVGL